MSVAQILQKYLSENQRFGSFQQIRLYFSVEKALVGELEDEIESAFNPPGVQKLVSFRLPSRAREFSLNGPGSRQGYKPYQC